MIFFKSGKHCLFLQNKAFRCCRIVCGLYNAVKVVCWVYLLSLRLQTLPLRPDSAKTAQIALLGKWLGLVCSGAEMLLYPMCPKIPHGNYSRNGREQKAQKEMKPFHSTVRTGMLQSEVTCISCVQAWTASGC